MVAGGHHLEDLNRHVGVASFWSDTDTNTASDTDGIRRWRPVQLELVERVELERADVAVAIGVEDVEGLVELGDVDAARVETRSEELCVANLLVAVYVNGGEDQLTVGGGERGAKDSKG